MKTNWNKKQLAFLDKIHCWQNHLCQIFDLFQLCTNMVRFSVTQDNASTNANICASCSSVCSVRPCQQHLTFWPLTLRLPHTSCISDIYHLKKTSHLTFSHKDPSRPFQQFWSDHWTSCFDLSRGWRKHNLWSPKVDAIHAKTRQSFVEGSFWRTGKLCKTQMDNCLNSRVSHLSNNKRLRS